MVYNDCSQHLIVPPRDLTLRPHGESLLPALVVLNEFPVFLSDFPVFLHELLDLDLIQSPQVVHNNVLGTDNRS